MFKKIVLLLIIPIILFLSSCSSFMGDDGMLIEEVTTKLNEDGSTTITISFTDDNEDVVFTIPQGETGLAGVGIKDITEEKTEEGKSSLLITLTDDSTYEIPLVSVEDIIDIASTHTEGSNETIITVTTTKGEYYFPINDPVSIIDISYSQDTGTGDIILTITMSDDDSYDIIIPKGERGTDGRGIASITQDEDDTSYSLIVTYTDGSSETFPFAKPQTTKWYSGNGDPSTSLPYGTSLNDGDFYFDKANFIFYQYDMFNFKWEVIADLGLPGTTCTVTFDARANGGQITNGSNSIKCQRGSYIALADIPTASKEGYTFVGWYTAKTGDGNVNATKFTDLTPVFSDLTLYACFVENTTTTPAENETTQETN